MLGRSVDLKPKIILCHPYIQFGRPWSIAFEICFFHNFLSSTVTVLNKGNFKQGLTL